MGWIIGQTAGYIGSIFKTGSIFRPELQKILLILLGFATIFIFTPTFIVMAYLSHKKRIKLQTFWWTMIIFGSGLMLFGGLVVFGWISAVITASIVFAFFYFLFKEEEKKEEEKELDRFE